MKRSPDAESPDPRDRGDEMSDAQSEVDLSSLVPIFLAETEENLARAELALLTLEEHPGDKDSLDEVFRVVHTVKGDAATLGMKTLSHFAHRVEDALDLLRSGQRLMSSDLASALLQTVDVIRELVAEGEGATVRSSEEMEQILAAVTGQPGTATATEAEAAGATSGTRADAGTLVAQDTAATTLRVDVGRLDQLLTLSGELTVAHSQLVQALEERSLSYQALLELAQSTDRLYQDLQELVMKVRMVPVGPTFRRFKRVVRDQAIALGKEAALELTGTDVELDNSVLQRLRDPLTHMLRNALAHGIEDPEERQALGKQPAGRVALRTRREGGGIVIEVRDDGRGLDQNAIISKARALGLIAKDAKPDARELFQLVFAPGLSTAAAITDAAGRGVGLDVVQQVVSELRGVVEVDSTPGQGTTLSIRLPLTLAVIDGLHVNVGNQVFVFALDTVVEVLDLPSGAFPRTKASAFVGIRDQQLGCVRLATLLGIEAREEAREKLVVKRVGRTQVGVVVDDIQGKTQTLIKPLPRILRRTPGFSGLASLADGSIALILDVAALLRERRITAVGGEGSFSAPLSGGTSAADTPRDIQ